MEEVAYVSDGMHDAQLMRLMTYYKKMHAAQNHFILQVQ